MFENAKIRVHFPKTFLDQTLAKISWQTNQSAFSDPQLGNDATYALFLSKNVQLSQPFIQLPFPVERTGKTRSED